MQKKPELRIFLDSNVVFSGLHSSQGPGGKILDLLVANRLMAVVSQQVLEEVVRTIKEKLPAALPVLSKLLESISLEIVRNPSSSETITWAKTMHTEDAAILAAAITAQPDYLVTGDKHFFENRDIAKKSGLRIVTPGQFLSSIGDDP